MNTAPTITGFNLAMEVACALPCEPVSVPMSLLCAEFAVSVRDMLRLASEASDSDKHDRVLIDPDGNSLFLGSLMVRPQPGSKWRTRA